MFWFCLVFSLTVLLLGMVPQLPPFGWYLAIASVGTVISGWLGYRKLHHLCIIALAIVCGWSWAMGWGLWQQQYQLATTQLTIVGQIAGLPQTTPHRLRFDIAVQEIVAPTGATTDKLRKLRISWYDYPADTTIWPGQQWRFDIKARQPHSFMNPNGFDYEGWLIQQGIQANAYINGEASLLAPPHGYWFSRLRMQLREKIIALDIPNQATAIITALMIGDRSQLSDDAWRVLFRTGISHLIAISGLHLTLVGGFIFILLFFVISRLPWTAIPARKTAAALTLLAIWLYAFSVGLSLPTQRAALMLSSFLIAIILMRRPDLMRSFVTALAVVLLFQPLAGFNAGFYLSFIAVAIVLLVGRNPLSTHRPEGSLQRGTHYTKQLLLLQLILVVGLAPLSALFFHALSPIGLLVNLVAIPLTSFILMPWILVNWLLLFILPPLADPSLQLLGSFIHWCYVGLDYVASQDWSIIYLTRPHPWLILLALVGGLLCLSQRRPGFYLIAIIFFIPIFFPIKDTPPIGTVRILFLDVGQGLAVHLRTANHNLLFDAGPRYSRHFDAGSDIIASYLHSYGINQLDRIIISHYDIDHRGGLKGLLEYVKVNQLMMNFANRHDAEKIPCRTGQAWQWDQVSFQVLHPSGDYVSKRRNNRSCVILVTTGNHKLLLTGDIEAGVERQLINQWNMTANILQVPHHGSASSSHPAWVEEVAPDYAVFSAGFGNRFSHPADEVVSRYQDADSAVLTSWREGAMEFDMSEREIIYHGGYRDKRARYWHRDF